MGLKSYIVIRKHCLGHPIDTIIKLTDEKAAALVGKVRLKTDHDKESDNRKKTITQAAEIKALQARIVELDAEVVALTEKVNK